MESQTESPIERAARLIKQERERRGWTKEDAFLAGGIGLLTWGYVERGKRPGNPDAYPGVDQAFGFPAGTTQQLVDGTITELPN